MPDERFPFRQVEGKRRSDDNVIAVRLYRGQIGGLDISGKGHDPLRGKIHLFEGLGEKDGIRDIGGVHQDVRFCLYQRADLTGHVRRVGCIGDVGDDLVAEFLGVLGRGFSDVGAEFGVLIEKGDGGDFLAGLLFEVFQELKLVSRKARIMGADPEEIFEISFGQGRGRGIRAYIRVF